GSTTQSSVMRRARSTTLRSRARLIVRVVALAAWTAWLFAIRVLAACLALFSPDIERRVRGVIFRAWARGACAIAGARITVTGTPPSSPYLLVSNHLSYFDTFVYARLLGCVFVSMVEVDRWPLFGRLARGMNTVFIDRNMRRDAMRVNEIIGTRLRRGEGILVFPESTTTYGDRVLPFKPALLEPAIVAELPVHHATISYSAPAGEATPEEAICWVDDTPFLKHAMKLLALRRFYVSVTFGEAGIVAADRKALAAALQDAIEKNLNEQRAKS
ncbi:MAG TPA: lysophospholipid acyltransferase family protein, partial [Candidatus Hydrogenedentes bacterium]|nr:lysophospholipid acyltransferase family protein [Candidatus Hydrogenedentota bacterium]